MKRLILVCAVVAFCISPLSATITTPTDLPDVVSTATLIVRGRVVDTRSFAEVANGPVMTAVTITNDELLKGSAGATVTFLVHGGELGRYRYMVVGSPTFRVGEQAYFFLKRTSAGVLWPVGMSAGVYRMSMASTGAGSVNAPVIAGVTATPGANVQRGDVRRKPMASGEFTSLVRMLMSSRSTAAVTRGRK